MTSSDDEFMEMKPVSGISLPVKDEKTKMARGSFPLQIAAGFAAFVIVAVLVGVLIWALLRGNGKMEFARFKSCDEMQNAIAEPSADEWWLGSVWWPWSYSWGHGCHGDDWNETEMIFYAVGGEPEAASADGGGESDAASDVSGTNNQVENVDEADIVKVDSQYAYVIHNVPSGDGYGCSRSLIIARAYPVSELDVTARIDLGTFSAKDLFLSGDEVLVLGHRDMTATVSRLYDVTNRSNPVFVREIEVSGTYVASRMVGRVAYVVTSHDLVHGDSLIPSVAVASPDAETQTAPVCECTDVGYFTNVDIANLLTVMAVDMDPASTQPYVSESIAVPSGVVYVSASNVYVAALSYGRGSRERTAVARIAFDGMNLQYQGLYQAQGSILNQFSMDEHNGYFRVAMTSGRAWGDDEEPSSAVHVFKLGGEDGASVDPIGSVEGMAPGESIQSVRFKGPRAYVVTFRQVDPLFVVDLGNPAAPAVLGQLKVPGFSEYLHLTGDGRLIGVGRDGTDAGELLGLKVSLFDVRDPANPTEQSTLTFGNSWGTQSIVSEDHKAFLYDSDTGLLVLPILEAALGPVNEYGYRSEVPVNDGAYVLHVSEGGLAYRGNVTHFDWAYEARNPYPSVWTTAASGRRVLRAFTMDETLYSLSNSYLVASDLATLARLAEVRLVQD